jgi:late competence protein required for DNA uptake (superfamily II DNA/RNA helicase)
MRGKPRKKPKPPYKIEAKVYRESEGLYLILSSGRVKCGSCGNESFRVVVDYNMNVHLYCARCNCEHRVYLGEEGVSLDEADD